MQLNQKLAASQVFFKDFTSILSDLSLFFFKFWNNYFKENLSMAASVILSFVGFLDPPLVTVRVLFRMCCCIRPTCFVI